MNTQTKPIQKGSTTKRMILGGAIALILIIVFLSGVKNPDPAWGKYWMIKPLLVVPTAGVMGGLFYNLMNPLRYQGGWMTILATFISIIGYVVILWIGTVLGLNGTLWN